MPRGCLAGLGLCLLCACGAAPPPLCGPQTFLNSLERCVPRAWKCGPMYYAGGSQDGCDCDCGVADPDCGLSGAPTYCHRGGRTLKVASCRACYDLPPF